MELLSQADRDRIVTTARSLLKPRVVFRPYGRDPLLGLDCIGVILWVGKQCKMLPQDLDFIYAYPPQREVFEMFDHHAIRVEKPNRGSLVIFTYDGETPRHTGICEFADGKWKSIGIDVQSHRPWVTMTPIETRMVWAYYDFVP